MNLIGKKVRFTYLKESTNGVVNGIFTKDFAANAENYKGKIVGIRSIEKNPVSNTTLRYGKIKGDRSDNLVTVELKDGFTKAFYDGRMLNLKVK
jgi:phage major head subunit gpT-like protein|tara:strand:- start:1548 stop:1829 length:282 start_codon:yes stop_codon:yes gene_type:complete